MKENRLFTLLAFLSAAGYLTAGLTHFLMPPEQLHFARKLTSEFFLSLQQNPTAFHIHYAAFIIALLLTTGVFIHEQRECFLFKITQFSATIGLFLLAFDFSRMHFLANSLASKFQHLPAQMKDTVLLYGLDRLDPYGITFLLIGLHLIHWNGKAIIDKTMPKWLYLLGLAGGILLQLVFLGLLIRSPFLITLAAGVGGCVLFPAWLTAFGLYKQK